MTALTGCVVTTHACRGRRNSDGTSRFTSLSLSFGILPLTLMNGATKLSLRPKSSISFLSPQREGFSPRGTGRQTNGRVQSALDTGELVFHVYWLNQLDDVRSGTTYRSFRWRSGGVKYPRDIPPFRYLPSPL